MLGDILANKPSINEALNPSVNVDPIEIDIHKNVNLDALKVTIDEVITRIITM